MTTLTQTAQPLPPISRMAFILADAVYGWEVRRLSRRKLAHLDAHLLDDIGLTAGIARTEAEKPFWRA